MKEGEGQTVEASARDRTWVVFGIATAVAFALIWARSEMGPTADHDGHWYSMLSQYGSNEAVKAPFRNRPLTPLLSSLLPLPWGFVVVTSLALGASVAALDRFLRSFVAARTALAGVALLVATGTVQTMLVIPFHVDAVTLAVSCVVLVLLHERRWVPLVAVMPFAVANHELALILLVPIVLTARREKRLPDAALIAVASIAMWWVLHRSGVLPVNDRATFLDHDERTAIVGWNIARFGSVPGAVWEHFVVAFGAAGFLAPFGWRRAPQLVRDSVWMVLPCAALCLGATQWSRVFGVVVPVAVALACTTLADRAVTTPART